MDANEKRYDALDDFALNEILAMSDDEIMAATGMAEEDLGRSALRSALATAGRDRLAQASAAAARDRSRAAPIRSGRGAASLRSIRAGDAGFDRRLTLAARNAGYDFAADEAGMEQDMAEIESWLEKNGKE